MRKHATIATSDTITYWPCYVAGMGLCILFGVFCLLALSMIVWLVLSGNAKNNLGTMLFMCALVIVFLVLIRSVRKIAYTKIYISRTEIQITNAVTNSSQFIKWEDVCEIWYYKNKWHGIESFRIGDAVLPVQGVSAEQMTAFFPTRLKAQDGEKFPFRKVQRL